MLDNLRNSNDGQAVFICLDQESRSVLEGIAAELSGQTALGGIVGNVNAQYQSEIH
jgi:hypothetical protein